MDNSMIGKTLQNGKYKIVRVLGQGGFGITYEGVQTGLNRRVAIKEFFMKDYCEREEGTSQVTFVGTKGNRELVKRFREKFVKEAQLIAKLEEVSHIIRIYDVFEENGTAYYVMQFIDGGSLKDLVARKVRLSKDTAVRYISQIADALSALHSRQIMHLDIKPDNILLKDDEVVLIDFGISKHYAQGGDATTTTPVGRSKGYAPLEQYKEGGVQTFSPETDIYSLGATLYFLLTGTTPIEATELPDTGIICPKDIPANLKKAITKAMQLKKSNRPHSITEFLSYFEESNGDSNHFHQQEHTRGEQTKIDTLLQDNDGGKPAQINSQSNGPIKTNTLLLYIIIALFVIMFSIILYLLLRQPNIMLTQPSNSSSNSNNIEVVETNVQPDKTENENENKETPEKEKVEADYASKSSDGYEKILSLRKLTEADLQNKTKRELELLRNSVYARYGYKFKRDDLFNYFSQFPWYKPITTDMLSVYNSMSEIEQYNVTFIKDFE